MPKGSERDRDRIEDEIEDEDDWERGIRKPTRGYPETACMPDGRMDPERPREPSPDRADDDCRTVFARVNGS